MYKDLIKEKTLFSLQTPATVVPNPNSTDYEKGFIERYFIQKVNDKNAYNKYHEALEKTLEKSKTAPFGYTHGDEMNSTVAADYILYSTKKFNEYYFDAVEIGWFEKRFFKGI